MHPLRRTRHIHVIITWLLLLSLIASFYLVLVCYILQLPTIGPSIIQEYHTPFELVNGIPRNIMLHVLVAVYNPCSDSHRYRLAKDSIAKLQEHNSSHLIVYVIELALGNESFYVTKANEKRHLQLRAGTGSAALPFWYKENLLNIGVQKLLPPDWEMVAWVDADIYFDHASWADLAIGLLSSQQKDAIQLFSHAIFLNPTNGTERVFSGYAYNFIQGLDYYGYGNDLWHPGFAWAYSRMAYDRMGGFYETELSGLGDGIMAHALRGGYDWAQYMPQFSSDGHLRSVLIYNTSCKGLRMGYVPGIIRHYFHGSFADRNYLGKRKIYDRYGFDPSSHLQRDASTGLLVATESFPLGLANAIKKQCLK